jgi:hypothetical protein
MDFVIGIWRERERWVNFLSVGSGISLGFGTGL